MGNRDPVLKATAISDARITFVSLVKKAANKKRFLITKAEDGKVSWETESRIILKEESGDDDDKHHYVTGIVYEPLVEDTQGNFMTAEEIAKAEHWYMRNAQLVDEQHSFDPVEGTHVVESWLAKSDQTIGDEEIKEGTWLMTVEVTDPDVWDSIQKGEITGFSMGGTGLYSKEDVDLNEEVKKTDSPTTEVEEKKGFLAKMAKWLGIEEQKPVEKSQVAEDYAQQARSNNFWAAESALEKALRQYDYSRDQYVYTTDPDAVKEALEDFSAIITKLLTSTPDELVKSVEGPEKDENRMSVEKAGKAMSAANKKTLAGICESLNSFVSQFDDAEGEAAKKDDDKKDEGTTAKQEGETETKSETEETEVTKAEVQELIKSEIAKAAAPTEEKPAEQKEVEKSADAPEEITAESIKAMVQAELEKSAEPEKKEPEQKPETITKADAEKIVHDAVQEAVSAVLKSRGVPTSLNDEQKKVEKSGEEECYLHGLL